MILEKYIPLVKFIASIMGEHCEVVLHDVRNPESSIIAIENSHISGRKVGGVITDLIAKIVQQNNYNGKEFISNYVVVAKDNKICQSSSFLIRNDEGEIIGMLCVNFDMSALLMTKDFLDKFIKIKIPSNISNISMIAMSPDEDESTETEEASEIVEHFLDSPHDVINLLIERELSNYEVPVNRMTQDERIEIVKNLNEQGLFLFKGGVSELAKQLEISEPTIYRYIHKIKEIEGQQ